MRCNYYCFADYNDDDDVLSMLVEDHDDKLEMEIWMADEIIDGSESHVNDVGHWIMLVMAENDDACWMVLMME